jgi:ATP-dependent 26S proteasome regulatory subunit
MMIELSKLRPMNMDKKDVTKAIFRDRAKIGSSCADVSPMEVDLNTTFKNVGGRAEHINCLKEIVVLPLLYPEIFSKFNITPPRGGKNRKMYPSL